ncbi:hypothetical protein CANCADRAFT_147306 [Tortispora caseinolytica NRRL Y-17796]|uniref:Actin-related protein 4 n=1 Tax=Tortispora caseinolytica NRRL Y-17796 TaxID=767744 RepID=A0A1E4TII5_9ASCO|nr:hypothetical protein CANCADRAFT_147306 [Tortispora caseinolytica NRRL Y-17796]
MSSPAPAVYGGDEISAIVLDPGSQWTRAGFAGEDSPKAVVPTDYIVHDPPFIGDDYIHVPRSGAEVANPMADGFVSDWDGAVKIWDYAVTKKLGVSFSDHPLLMTEPAWTSTADRKKAVEIAFEELQVPAFYLARSSVCACFAAGKATALVLDVGHKQMSATPVYDGLILKKSSFHNGLGGDFLSKQIAAKLAAQDITVTPYCLVSRKAVQLDPFQAADSAVVKSAADLGLTESFLNLEKERVIHEFKESVCQVMEVPYNEGGAETRPPRPFEFPDGYNINVTTDRFTTSEALFNPKGYSAIDVPKDTVGAAKMVYDSIMSCDVDARANLAYNIVITGGTSLVQGFTERVQQELFGLLPGLKVRIYAAGNSSERKYGGWIGGSVLSSLGTFHQMWISKKEYEEAGSSIVEKRCK